MKKLIIACFTCAASPAGAIDVIYDTGTLKKVIMAESDLSQFESIKKNEMLRECLKGLLSFQKAQERIYKESINVSYSVLENSIEVEFPEQKVKTSQKISNLGFYSCPLTAARALDRASREAKAITDKNAEKEKPHFVYKDKQRFLSSRAVGDEGNIKELEKENPCVASVVSYMRTNIKVNKFTSSTEVVLDEEKNLIHVTFDDYVGEVKLQSKDHFSCSVAVQFAFEMAARTSKEAGSEKLLTQPNGTTEAPQGLSR